MSFLEFLYDNSIGRMILKGVTRPGISKAAGTFLDTSLSQVLISGFVKRNGIDLGEYEKDRFNSFNDFFTRKIKDVLRPIGDGLISPCDGLLSVFDIKDGLVVPVKGSIYSISDLLRDETFAKEYDGGKCLVFRLCVNHYHRYAYAASGQKGKNVHIPGVLHTVRPVAVRKVPVYIENSREYTVIESDSFGTLVQMEVGALLVGKIQNYEEEGNAIKGAEKGKFLYGGSTIILLIKKDKVKLDSRFSEEEIEVKYGEKIGEAIG